MKLRFSPTSPYVRKVNACAIELGIADQIERVPTNPWAPDTDIARDNPLGKVPALTTGDGTVLFDSPVICEYLDNLVGGNPLFPVAGPKRWNALRQQALGDGILDASVMVFIEGNMRPEETRWQRWKDINTQAVEQSLAALEKEAVGFGNEVNIGLVTAACALGYVDFRLPELNWRESCPKLATWYGEFSKRPSIAETVPVAPT